MEESSRNVHITTFRLSSGSVAELVDLIIRPGNLADILRAADGFCSYDIVDIGDGRITSMSVWTSPAAAEAVRTPVAHWMRDNLVDRAEMTDMAIGPLALHVEP